MLLFHQIDPSRNRARFYSLHLSRTLFGEVELVRCWGRVATQGRVSRTICASPRLAIIALIRAARHRRRRGYLLIRK